MLGVALAPSGKRIAFAQARLNGNRNVLVKVARPDGTHERTVATLSSRGLSVSNVGPQGGLDWSPDSRRIAFATQRGLWIARANGKRARLIVARRGAASAVWSPRGDRIAYVAWKGGNGDVYSATLDGFQTRHSTSAEYDGYIAWSPDGSKLAYIHAYSMSYAGLYGDVVVVDVASNTAETITQMAGATSKAPSWSPDGQWLTFAACKPGQSGDDCAVVIVKSDGLQSVQLTGYAQYTNFPVWRP
jgi:Tol biopolymer transport system component